MLKLICLLFDFIKECWRRFARQAPVSALERICGLQWAVGGA